MTSFTDVPSCRLIQNCKMTLDAAIFNNFLQTLLGTKKKKDPYGLQIILQLPSAIHLYLLERKDEE